MTTLKCKCIEMNLLTPGEYYGHFLFTPLEGGEGATLATMIRRSLLSSLFESKISGVRFAGVSDEFSNMQGVREDLLEIILNLKEIIIKNPSYQPCYGRIKVYGPAIVTASSLVLPKGVVVVNPRSHILTVSENSLIELEVKIEPRKIYSIPQNRKSEATGNFISVDSNFTPVLKVNSYIESISQDPEPFSQSPKNKSEELHIEIYTNGALLPHQALMIAGNRLAAMVLSFQRILFCKRVGNETKTPGAIKSREIPQASDLKNSKRLSKKALSENFSEPEKNDVKNSVADDSVDSVNNNPTKTLTEAQPAKTELKQKRIRQTSFKKAEKALENNLVKTHSFEELGLSKRVIKTLRKLNITKIDELLKMDSQSLSKLSGLGAVSIKEITEKTRIFVESSIRK